MEPSLILSSRFPADTSNTKRMFKSAKRPRGQKLRQRGSSEDEVQSVSQIRRQRPPPLVSNALSFEESVNEIQQKRKGLFNTATVTWAQSPSLSATGCSYDAQSLASLRAAQRIAPPPDTNDSPQEVPLETRPDDSNENMKDVTASQVEEDEDFEQAQAASYIPLRSGETRKHSDVWSSPQDDPVMSIPEDEDEELAAWEAQLTARGSGTSRVHSLKPKPTAKQKQPVKTVDLRKILLDATETAEAAQRSVQARYNELLENDSALAQASADLAVSRSKTQSLTTARQLLSQALDLPPDQLRAALRRAVALAQEDQRHLEGLAVYALDPLSKEEATNDAIPMSIEDNDRLSPFRPQQERILDASNRLSLDGRAKALRDIHEEASANQSGGLGHFADPPAQRQNTPSAFPFASAHQFGSPAVFPAVANADAAAALRAGLGFASSSSV